MNFYELAQKRYSCRKFSDKKVERELIDQIVAAANAAPTAVNKQPFQIFLVDTPEAREKLVKTSRYTYGAKTFLVVGYRENEGWVRGCDGRNFADVDATIAATHAMMEICELGLGTTWVGDFDAALLKEMFPEMAGHELIAIFPIGYPAEDDQPNPTHFVRKAAEEILTVL